MVFVDTNVLVDFIFAPNDQADAQRFKKVYLLFEEISTGKTKAITSEVVLHETFYVLVIRSRSINSDQFCEIIDSILTWPGWAMDTQELSIFQRALSYLRVHPSLEFSDAVIAARAEALGAELATFDKRLATAFDGPIWADS